MQAKIFKHQQWQILLLSALVILFHYAVKVDPTLVKGELWGLSTSTWLIIAILSPVVHQIYVLLLWRSELHYKSITNLFGKNGFKLYKIGFTILILSRPVTIILLAISNAGTLEINPAIRYILSGLILLPAIYLFISIKKYFGIDRAFGIDHFYPEKMKNIPMVNRGIFKYTSNGMYVFGFLILWIPGILWQSKAAILLALFSHIYIWIHYYFTELPDMKEIYGSEIK